MSLDEHVRQSLDTTLGHLTHDLQEHLEALVADVTDRARRDRDAAVDEARRQADERLAAVEAEHRSTLQAAGDEAAQRLADALSARDAAQADAVIAAEWRGRAAERESMLAAFERLLAAFERIDACATLTSTLDVLADSLATEAARSMLLVVRGQELKAWRLHGFADPVDASGVTLPLGEAGGFAEAVARGRAVQIHAETLGDEASRALGFARLGEHEMGLAVPVAIATDTVAVVYADDGAMADRTVPASWPEVVRILARHASRHLSALTALRLSGHRDPGFPPERTHAAEPEFATAFVVAGPAGDPASSGPLGVDHR